MKPEHRIEIICGNAALAREYLRDFHRAALSLRLRPVVRLAEDRQLGTGISLFLLDQSGIEGRSKQGLKCAVERLVEAAPVVVVAAPEWQSELAALLTSGKMDFVARTGNFVPVAIGLIERRIRLARAGADFPIEPNGEWRTDFGEILRHEVNNPLTGILGNAEMLLARRDRLPASAIERLETIARLAVRLRETVRRLSSAAELRHAG